MASRDAQLSTARDGRSEEPSVPAGALGKTLGALGGVAFVLDLAARRLLYVDPRVKRILGYEPARIRDDPELLRHLVHRDDAPRAARALDALLRDHVDQHLELRMLPAGGGELWIEAAATVVREGGRPARAVGALLDVTERKRLEQVLRDELEARVRARTARQAARLARSLAERDRLDAERRVSEARFEAFAASAIEAIVIAGEDGRITMVNSRAEAMFGRSAAEMLGQPLTLLMPRRYHETYRRGLERYLRTGENLLMGRTIELAALREDGTEVPVEISFSSFRTADGRTQLIALLRDITERKQAEAALRRANEELERARHEAEAATRAKSEFLANMSHDIRTPMNGVIGMAELLAGTDLSPQQREYVEMVRASAESLRRLLNDILDFSKIEAGKLELVPTPFSLPDALGEMLHPFAVLAGAKGVELVYHVSPDVPEVVVGDVDRLRQVVSNLVGNAIKFTER
ncbi:MAG TPA: PAS domain S-box protein, partial [Sandaracinaceae bacterium]